jgi:hypothetical protein
VPLAAPKRQREPLGIVEQMRVKASPGAIELVQSRGGKLYVTARHSRCCHGALTVLDTSNEPGERSFRRLPFGGIELYLDAKLSDPDELELDVGGLRHKQVHAYWNGCAYVV